MARAPYRPVELSEALRPVAAPVDTFVQAQAPSRDTSLQDLARSLSGLGGSLAGLVGQRDKQTEEEDKIRGEAAFWQSNGTGAADAVSKGLMPAQASPAFMRGWKQAEGTVAGGVLEQKFSAAYDAWEGKTSADPKAFDGFLQGFLKENVKTNDPDVLQGLLPKVRQLNANYLQRHIGDASKAATQGLLQASAAQDSQALEAANTAGLASRKGTDYEAVFKSIEANREAKLKLGANAQDYDKQVVVDGITAAAVQLRDPKILDFLDRKVPGTDYAWSNTPYGREQRQKTIDTLETMGRRSIGDDEKRRREEKAEAKDSVTRDTIAAITKDPRAPIPEELLARGEKVDPDFRINAIRWRDTIGKQGQTSDPEDLLAVTSDILNGGGLQRVQRAMRDGVFRNPEDLTRAYKLAEGMKEHGPALTAIFSSDQSKTIERTIRERTLRQNDRTAILDPDGMSDTGLAARHDYRMQILAWMAANPGADPIQQQEAISKIGAAILGRLGTNDDGDKTYDRAGLTGGNPFENREPAAPGAVEGGRSNPGATKVPNRSTPPGAPAVPPAPTPMPETDAMGSPIGGTEMTTDPGARPAHKRSTYDGAAAWFKSLSPESKAVVERKAAQAGIDVRQASQILYQQALDAGLIASDDDPTPVSRPKLAPVQPPAAPVQTVPATPAPGRQSSAEPGSMPPARAPDGTPIETASASTTTAPGAPDPTAEAVSGFQRVVSGAYSGQATFDGIKATLNGRTFTGPASPEQVARQFEGLDETNPKHRAALTAFLSKAAGQRIDPAKVPWCAAFVDSVLDASGRQTRGSLRAADFLDYGTATDQPTRGDVVVFKSMARGSSGHVGFVVGIEGDRVRYLAGNDDNKVQEDTLPLSKVAGFRRPPEAGTRGPFAVGARDGGGASKEVSAAFVRALSSTGKAAGTFAAPEVQADPRAARILDLVSGAELKGTEAGNYNAVYGNAAATEDLSRRTLDQTIAWSQSRGTSSSATGRYQFLASTLESLKSELKLSGSEPFSPALQDRMALALLNRRGFREWTVGKLTDDAFAANLAKEWASLPNPATGRSHYAGDGVNKALVSPSQVRAALTGTGAFPAARLEQAAQTLAKQAGGPEFTRKVRTMFGGGSGAGGQQAGPAVDAYANAPSPDLAARLRAANPDPVGNSAAVLAEVAPDLAAVIRRAQAENPKLRLAVVSRKGEAGAEVWPVDAEGRISFDPAQQDAVGAAVRRSATQLGFGVNIGGGLGGGRTHIEMAPTTRA